MFPSPQMYNLTGVLGNYWIFPVGQLVSPILCLRLTFSMLVLVQITITITGRITLLTILCTADRPNTLSALLYSTILPPDQSRKVGRYACAWLACPVLHPSPPLTSYFAWPELRWRYYVLRYVCPHQDQLLTVKTLSLHFTSLHSTLVHHQHLPDLSEPHHHHHHATDPTPASPSSPSSSGNVDSSAETTGS